MRLFAKGILKTFEERDLESLRQTQSVL